MKPFIFTVEETNLMCIFDTENKNTLLNDLRESLNDVYEPEMREIYDSTIEKLETVSDGDFSELGLFIADDFIDGEEWDIGD